jgi:hypothetical protein
MAQQQLLFFSLFLFQFYLPSEDVKQNNIIVLNEQNLCLFLSPSLLFVALSLSLSLPPIKKAQQTLQLMWMRMLCWVLVLCGQ